MDTPQALRERVIGKATEDGGFRSQLIADPKGTIQSELGINLPDSLSVEVHEESTGTAHLVLPPDSKLSEGDLQAVAGGFFGSSMGSAKSLLNW